MDCERQTRFIVHRGPMEMFDWKYLAFVLQNWIHPLKPGSPSTDLHMGRTQLLFLNRHLRKGG